MKENSAMRACQALFTLLIAGRCILSPVYSQCPPAKDLVDEVNLLIRDPLVRNQDKLQKLELLGQRYTRCYGAEDSNYAAILQHLAGLRFLTSTRLRSAVEEMVESIRINSSGRPGSCARNRADGFYHLGYFYSQLSFYREAVVCFDSAISLAEKIPDERIVLGSEVNVSYTLSLQGDYERCAEVATGALNLAGLLRDTLGMTSAIYYRAKAFVRQKKVRAAREDIGRYGSLLRKDDYPGLSKNYELQSDLDSRMGQYAAALVYRDKMISLHERGPDAGLLANDYLEKAILYEKGFSDYPAAAKLLRQGLSWAQKAHDSSTAARILQDLGVDCFFSRQYRRAVDYYQASLRTIFPAAGMDDVLRNPDLSQCMSGSDAEFTLLLFENKSESLQKLYKESGDIRFLTACIRTARLADSIITYLRHQQTGELSKLYWRDQSRAFFANALEACWLAGDPSQAFYFMEKSRAVLLNDKLNELGAAALLPDAEAAKGRNLQLDIIEKQQALQQANGDSAGFQVQQALLLKARDEWEKYVKSLEQQAPAYFQYKYADEVPSLDSFEHSLAGHGQSFIQYFVQDTTIYILTISSLQARLVRLCRKGIAGQLDRFLWLCSDKQALNSDYRVFADLSDSIFRVLFEPLHIPKGRVVVCPDNFLIPFEALCTDTSGRHFLLYDYMFDYVYSARYLLKTFNNPEGKGNFLGVAPASFAAGLHVPDLQQSVAAIRTAASYYSSHTCMTGEGANRKYFMEEAPGYSIVNVYSHARADSGDQEPLLFMSDSVIHLSELQLLQHPSAQLVVLSACQTNAGKNATGEGIYSLARGFATAGIPSVASTLWEADERSIYAITEQFHRYLSQGMRKDEALQKAKLFFIGKGRMENLLPYYWANLVLIGNADPVKLSTPHHDWWIAFGMGCLLFLLFMALYVGLVRPRNRAVTPS